MRECKLKSGEEELSSYFGDNDAQAMERAVWGSFYIIWPSSSPGLPPGILAEEEARSAMLREQVKRTIEIVRRNSAERNRLYFSESDDCDDEAETLVQVRPSPMWHKVEKYMPNISRLVATGFSSIRSRIGAA